MQEYLNVKLNDVLGRIANNEVVIAERIEDMCAYEYTQRYAGLFTNVVVENDLAEAGVVWLRKGEVTPP